MYHSCNCLHIFLWVIQVKKYLKIIGISVLILAMLVYADESGAAVVKGLKLCGSSVIPALFPMFVGAKLLVGLLKETRLPRCFLRFWERFFGVSGVCFYGFFFGLLGGYPLGAAVISELYESKYIGKEDAEQSLRFCNNSGPGFFVAALGSKIFHSPKAGLILYGIHVASAFLVGCMLGGGANISGKYSNLREKPQSLGNLLIESIRNSCFSVLQICGLIVFFTVLGELVDCVGVFRLLSRLSYRMEHSELRAILQGLLELTSGIFSLENQPNSFIIAAFLMGWGGFCVHIQAATLWQKVGLHPKGYYGAKLLQGLLSGAIAWTILYGSVLIGAILVLSLLIIPVILRFFRKYTGNSNRYAL